MKACSSYSSMLQRVVLLRFFCFVPANGGSVNLGSDIFKYILSQFVA